jgi:hypothetical protein
MRTAEFWFRVNSKRTVKSLIGFHFLFFKAKGLILKLYTGRAAWKARSSNMESWEPSEHLLEYRAKPRKIFVNFKDQVFAKDI